MSAKAIPSLNIFKPIDREDVSQAIDTQSRYLPTSRPNTFPVQTIQPSLSPQGHTSMGLQRESGATILIVNDQREMLDLFSRMLAQEEYRILTALDGYRALQLARTENPHIIVSDVVMPGMDGLELCRRLKSDAATAGIPVLMTSALRAGLHHTLKGLECGADDYLEMPKRLEELPVKVARLAERSRVEAHYRNIVEHSTDIIYTTDAEGRITSINKTGSIFFGRPHEELIGLLISDVITLKSIEEIERGPQTGEFGAHLWVGTAENPQGKLQYLESITVTIPDGHGNVIGTRGTARNITEREIAKQRLSAQYLITRTLGEANTLEAAAPKIIQIICELLHVEVGLLWSKGKREGQPPRCISTWHLPPAMGGESLSDVLNVLTAGVSLPDSVWSNVSPFYMTDLSEHLDVERAVAAMSQGVCSGVIFPLTYQNEVLGVIELYSRRPYSLEEDVLNTISTIGIQIGQFIERKQAEAYQARLQSYVQKSALEWRLTFDAIEFPVLTLDLGGYIRRLNRAAKEMSEKSYEELIGCHLKDVAPGGLWQLVAELLDSIQKSADLSCLTRVVDEGKTWEIAANLVPGLGDNAHVIVLMRDITHSIELEASVRRHETMAMLGSLVAGVAHEVRNPLFGISSTLDAFEVRFAEQHDFQKYTKVLRSELERLNDLMGDLLEFGKPLTQVFYQGSLDDLANQAVRSCASLAAQSQVRVENRVGQFPAIKMDRRRVIQVFLNLLENAIYHTSAGGVVTIDAQLIAQDKGPAIECSIADTGAGFQEEDLPKIFDPFFTRRRKGSGLGLSIVHRIMEEHGWKINARNRPEGGAVMVMTIPLNLDFAAQESVKAV